MRDRARLVKPGQTSRPAAQPETGKPGKTILHWMRREFRVTDNPGLLFAGELAAASGSALGVVICLPEAHELPSFRQLRFLLEALPALENNLRALRIPLFLRMGNPATEIQALLRTSHTQTLTTDFDPLRPAKHHLEQLCAQTHAEIWEVDGRNSVPCWLVSDKKEYMARTIRPKIHRLLPEFLHELPRLDAAPQPWPQQVPAADWASVEAYAAQAYPAPAVHWVLEHTGKSGSLSGEAAGLSRLRSFLRQGLRGYSIERNDPVKDASSRLSPWLHFGFLSALRVALEVAAANPGGQHPQEDKDAFLEELLVRRELSDNFCLYEPRYDSLDACANWARATLEKHRHDPRAYIYDFATLETGRTHQPLWNAAQRQLVETGFMHGYMRMYWAKKILEWSATPEEALSTVITLNDRWSLDGMDANGYAGAAWSVCGVHDRGWGERSVYGTIRYMNANGARRKFDAVEYVRRHAGAAQAQEFARHR